jgi:hypothetical protein
MQSFIQGLSNTFNKLLPVIVNGTYYVAGTIPTTVVISLASSISHTVSDLSKESKIKVIFYSTRDNK